jgi:hypothetical protein
MPRNDLTAIIRFGKKDAERLYGMPADAEAEVVGQDHGRLDGGRGPRGGQQIALIGTVYDIRVSAGEKTVHVKVLRDRGTGKMYTYPIAENVSTQSLPGNG